MIRLNDFHFCHCRSRVAVPILIAIAIALLLPSSFLAAQDGPASATPTESPSSLRPIESLESRLIQLGSETLVERVNQRGDASRGALLYHNPELTCVRCHEPADEEQTRLGPSLAEVNTDATVAFLVESLLEPSKQLTEGFQTETFLTSDGKQHSGLVVRESQEDSGRVTLVDPSRNGEPFQIKNEDIDERKVNAVSAMPNGLVGALNDEQSFYDLVRYLLEIKQGGMPAAERLRPPESFFATAAIPDYESSIDHRTLISSLNDSSLERGAAIYQQYCARCHGTDDQEGSMPSALRFGEGKFKNGNDPHSMYQTLTHGYGLMVAQRWMVPKQKHDVIHYIRETFLKEKNPDQYVAISDSFLEQLPEGTELGPDPVDRTPWSDMDYGNFLMNTYEVGTDGTNIGYKGIAVRLDAGPGGVSQGKHWILYDHDTMRVAAAWSGTGFIDYNGIHFNDRHNVHPRIVGDVHAINDHRPGWANPQTGTFSDSMGEDPRFAGRDGKMYGPLPSEWLKYRGLYQYGDRVVLDYSVGNAAILESPSLKVVEQQYPVFIRQLNVTARDKPLLMKVADVCDLVQQHHDVPQGGAIFNFVDSEPDVATGNFDGQHLRAEKTFDWRNDLSIVARIKTDQDGTIICQTNDGPEWVPGGTSLFVRDGRLVFDVGWVGAVTSVKKIDDHQWHQVGLVWQPDEEKVSLYIDGKLDSRDELEPGKQYDQPIVRIGYTAEDFPKDSTFWGEISNIVVWDRAISEDQIAAVDFDSSRAADKHIIADWDLLEKSRRKAESDVFTDFAMDRSGKNNHAEWQIGSVKTLEVGQKSFGALVQGIDDPDWQVVDGSLCLQIPAGADELDIAVLFAGGELPEGVLGIAAETSHVVDLRSWINGGPDRYPQTLASKIETMPQSDRDPFAVDLLNHPEQNPWACRMRLTGIDFMDDDTAFISAWDGSVWKVTGFLQGSTLRWQRIANGLFQPLGIRVVDQKIYVTCRDQLVMLKDLNADGAIDYYRSFNSDHQVTEHFHEFAMGLQSDAEGNFYYAKSARHALPALVAHHGTLLRVTADGSSTSIIGNGFRAANGVCLNPDGTFFVTDQEGHWTPKNRINWVRGDGGFYGNMMGYHNIDDDSDDAMEQPLCWVTNTFDRSPGELMWVPDGNWGPLSGSLLNLSYGMGQVFVVPHESVDLPNLAKSAKSKNDESKLLQGGMCALPIPLFPTGIMRGRFHSDGHLYCCGMYAWAGNQQKPGGLYRIRHTGQPSWLPKSIQAKEGAIEIEFSDALDEASQDASLYSIKTWDIRRTSNYGSDHLNQKEVTIQSVKLTNQNRSIQLCVSGLQTTRCIEVTCQIKTPDGRSVTRTINGTIHHLSTKD